MPKYTTGEIARLCDVSVRTVQYYDTRGILAPSELSEGGRRLYSEADVKKLKVICFLREAGISLNGISQLMTEEDPSQVIAVLIEQQEKELESELAERKQKLEMLAGIRREMKNTPVFSVESIGTIAYRMANRRKLKKMYAVILSVGIPLFVAEWASIALWVFTGTWWPTAAYAVASALFGACMAVYYHRCVAYICPQCHEVFKPRFWEMFWARHTPTLRRLTCPHCGSKGFCVETWGKEEKDNG